MVKRDEHINMKLVDGDEFDDEDLSDDEDTENVELHKLRVTKSGLSPMSGFTQVVVFIMFWFMIMGACMLTLHIVARNDPHRQMVIFVGLSAAWIILLNVFAIAVFVIDKYHSFSKQPRLSEALVHLQFILGGVVGGWLALCLTCYRPPGVKSDRMSGFICRGMICSAIGLTLVVLVTLKILVPNIQLMIGSLPLP